MTLRAARTAPARNTGVCWGGGGCAQTLSDLGADAVARLSFLVSSARREKQTFEPAAQRKPPVLNELSPKTRDER